MCCTVMQAHSWIYEAELEAPESGVAKQSDTSEDSIGFSIGRCFSSFAEKIDEM